MDKQEIFEALGYYVYALSDPRTDKIFYVGKGKGDRVLQHAKGIRCNNSEEDDSEKFGVIKEILAEGQDVKYYILRHGLKDEETAFAIESTIINLLTYPKFEKQELGHLTNIQIGHHQGIYGIKTFQEIEDFYGAEEFDLEPYILRGINFIAIKLNPYKLHEENNEDIFKQTRFCWRVSLSRANNCHYALAVVNGIVCGVYPCQQSWRSTRKEEVDPKFPQDYERYCFDWQEPTNPAEYQELKNALLRKRIKGLHKTQNAIAYFDQQKYKNKTK